jgi:hypothetical protein
MKRERERNPFQQQAFCVVGYFSYRNLKPKTTSTVLLQLMSSFSKSCEKQQLQNSVFFLDCQFLPHPFSKQILLIINLPQGIPSSIFFQLGIPKLSAATTRSDRIRSDLFTLVPM